MQLKNVLTSEKDIKQALLDSLDTWETVKVEPCKPKADHVKYRDLMKLHNGVFVINECYIGTLMIIEKDIHTHAGSIFL